MIRQEKLAIASLAASAEAWGLVNWTALRGPCTDRSLTPARDWAMARLKADRPRISVREIAQLLNVAPSTVQRAKDRQRAQAQKTGARTLLAPPRAQTPTACAPAEQNLTGEKAKLAERIEALEVENAELKAEMRRLTGCDLALRFVDEIGLQMGPALLLAILCEAYPRIVPLESLCELYEAGRARIGFGQEKPIGENLINVHKMELSKHFDRAGLPAPIEVIKKGRRLDHAVAGWMAGEFGAPALGALPDEARAMAQVMAARLRKGPSRRAA